MIKFILLLLISFPSWSDVMNLNNDMPTRLEDATPIDEHTVDVQYSAAFEKGESDVIRHRPNVRYGVSQDLQLEGEATIYSGGKESYSGQTDLGFLYRLNHSDNLFPEFSLSPVAIFPSGKGMDSMLYSLRVNVTTTLQGSHKEPITQVHLNYQLEHNVEPKDSERTDRNFYALGLSHLILKETALVADVFMEQEHERSEETYLLELGFHHHLGKKYFLGFSLGAGLGSSTADHQVLLAFEKQFN